MKLYLLDIKAENLKKKLTKKYRNIKDTHKE